MITSPAERASPTIDLEKKPTILNLKDLPQELVFQIKNKNQDILARFQYGENFPNVIIVLERSAILPSLAVVEKISQQHETTVIENLPVGKVLPYMFANFKSLQDDEFDEVDLNLHNSQLSQDFISWLKKNDDPTIKCLIENLRKLELEEKKILVIDDAKSTGETIELTMKLLLKAVYDHTPDFDTEIYFSGNFSWEKAIIAQLGFDFSIAEQKLLSTIIKGSLDLRRFKIELESGFYDLKPKELQLIKNLIEEGYRQGQALLGLNSEISIIMAGHQALMETKAIEASVTDEGNPALSLLTRFGFKELHKLSAQVKESFKKI